jgi:hypothetical protein
MTTLWAAALASGHGECVPSATSGGAKYIWTAYPTAPLSNEAAGLQRQVQSRLLRMLPDHDERFENTGTAMMISQLEHSFLGSGPLMDMTAFSDEFVQPALSSPDPSKATLLLTAMQMHNSMFGDISCNTPSWYLLNGKLRWLQHAFGSVLAQYLVRELHIRPADVLKHLHGTLGLTCLSTLGGGFIQGLLTGYSGGILHGTIWGAYDEQAHPAGRANPDSLSRVPHSFCTKVCQPLLQGCAGWLATCHHGCGHGLLNAAMADHLPESMPRPRVSVMRSHSANFTQAQEVSFLRAAEAHCEGDELDRRGGCLDGVYHHFTKYSATQYASPSPFWPCDIAIDPQRCFTRLIQYGLPQTRWRTQFPLRPMYEFPDGISCFSSMASVNHSLACVHELSWFTFLPFNVSFCPTCDISERDLQRSRSFDYARRQARDDELPLVAWCSQFTSVAENTRAQREFSAGDHERMVWAACVDGAMGMYRGRFHSSAERASICRRQLEYPPLVAAGHFDELNRVCTQSLAEKARSSGGGDIWGARANLPPPNPTPGRGDQGFYWRHDLQ